MSDMTLEQVSGMLRNWHDFFPPGHEAHSEYHLQMAEAIDAHLASQPAEQPRGGPVAWRSPDELPDVKANDCRFFQIAVRRKSGKVFSYPAVYCNSLALTVEYEPKESSGNRWSSHFLSEDLADEGELGFTGWWDVKSNCEYDTCYEPALEDDDELVAWCELPNWNADTAQLKPEQAVACGCPCEPSGSDGLRCPGRDGKLLCDPSHKPEQAVGDGMEDQYEEKDFSVKNALDMLIHKLSGLVDAIPRPIEFKQAKEEYFRAGVRLALVRAVAEIEMLKLSDIAKPRPIPRPASAEVGDGMAMQRVIDAALALFSDVEEVETADGLANVAQLHLWHALEDAVEKVGPADISNFTPRPAVATRAEVTDEMVIRAREAYLSSPDNVNPMRSAIEAALTAQCQVRKDTQGLDDD